MHLGDPDLILVHVSPTRRVYNRRHLAGAVYGDLHRELAVRGRDPATGDAEREWLLPTREQVEATLARWGVGELGAQGAAAGRAATAAPSAVSSPPLAVAAPPSAAASPLPLALAGSGAPTPASRAPRIVFYDDVGQNRQAIRGYWLLRLYRYPATRVHVLDGGLTAWVASGGPVTDGRTAAAGSARTAEGTPAARRMPAGSARTARDAGTSGHPVRLGSRDPSLIATADQVRAWSTEASAPGGPTRVLDVRSPDEFVGWDGRGARRGGRIPGARNRYFADFIRPDNTLRPVPETLALVRGSGVDPADVRAVYCQGGVRAALAWFVLHELAGLDGVRNYAGSWEEWGNREDVPVQSDVPVGSDVPA
jgi:3-mercaptopyruvate sulfurtransferase SseA